MKIEIDREAIFGVLDFVSFRFFILMIFCLGGCMSDDYVEITVGGDSLHIPRELVANPQDLSGGSQRNVTLSIDIPIKEGAEPINIKVILYDDYVSPEEKLSSLKERFASDLTRTVGASGEEVFTVPYLDYRYIFVPNGSYPLFLTCPGGDGNRGFECHAYSSRKSGSIFYSFSYGYDHGISLNQLDSLVLDKIDSLKGVM